MSGQEIPTVLIAYPRAFLCYGKFERKLSSILSNFNQFYIAYLADDNNFIKNHGAVPDNTFYVLSGTAPNKYCHHLNPIKTWHRHNSKNDTIA